MSYFLIHSTPQKHFGWAGPGWGWAAELWPLAGLGEKVTTGIWWIGNGWRAALKHNLVVWKWFESGLETKFGGLEVV